MLVKNFMLPRDKVEMIEPETPLEDALETMVKTPACRVIVVTTGPVHLPIGVITKTDLMKAYKEGMEPKTHKAKEVMSTTIETVLDTATRDAVAAHFESTKHKNAFVMNKENHFVGLVSALDVAIEVSRDDHAFPWNREALDTKYAVPKSPTGGSPKTKVKSPRSPRHTFEEISGEYV